MGAALYEAPVPEKEQAALRQWGFEPEALTTVVQVWPENRRSVLVFMRLRTQWRTGMNGPTGLDYGALPEVWRRTHTQPADRDDVFNDLQVLEVAALNEMNRKTDG